MKYNKQYGTGNGKNSFIQEPKYLEAYAKYLAKYVTAYQAVGIPVVAVAVQNEPFFSPPYPSCLWTPDELRDFISGYAGPEFRNRKIDAELWLGSMNNGNIDAFKPILDSPAAKFVDAVGVQWAGKMAVADLHRRYPDLKLVQTESECGNGSFDWNAAEHTFDLIRHYLSHGVSIYDYWNMVLDETGKSHWGWKQNALITVNQEDGSVTHTPEY
jgi:glucosylceramidase